jgi:hypothetical protein
LRAVAEPVEEKVNIVCGAKKGESGVRGVPSGRYSVAKSVSACRWSTGLKLVAKGKEGEERRTPEGKQYAVDSEEKGGGV